MRVHITAVRREPPGLTVAILFGIMDITSIMKDRTAIPRQQNLNSRIAGHVRKLRAESGMTLDALAAKSKVSRSMLSMIERGRISPTAVILEKVATGLGVPLAALFDDPSAPPNPVSRRGDRSLWRDPQSGYVRRNISPAGVSSPIRVSEVTLPAGAGVAYETAARDVGFHQQIWLQEGTIEVTVGTVTYRLGPDDCLAMQVNEPTTFRNRTRKAARYIVVITTERIRTPRNRRV